MYIYFKIQIHNLFLLLLDKKGVGGGEKAIDRGM